MDITHGIPDGAALAQLNGDWTLLPNTATGRFARRFTFALPTGGLADGLRWLPNTTFTLSLPLFDYDAHAAGAPEAAALTGSGDGVLVTFPVARTLLRVKVAAALANDSIEGRRTDGNVVTDDAFVSAGHGTSGATLNATDRQLVLRQRRAGTAIPLHATGIEQVIVRSAAANVRVAVVLPLLGDEVFSLGPDAGAVLTNPAVATNLGAPLAALLQSACDRLTDSLGAGLLPPALAATLVIESDTPARAHIANFVLRYRLLRRRFPDQAAKRVFDFGGTSLEARPLTIDVPHSAALWVATLRMMGPFNEAPAAADDNGASDGDAPPATAPAASDLGIALNAGESAAGCLQLVQAALIQGVTVELIGLAAGTAGRVRLLADDRGKPGESLGEGSLPTVAPGVRGVLRVDFVQSGVVGAGPVWVVVQCDSGALLWLTSAPDSSTQGSQVLRRARDVDWATVGAATGRGAVVSLVTAFDAEGDGTSAGSSRSAFHGVQLRLGNRRLRGALPAAGSPGAKETRFSIASAIAPQVQSAPAGAFVRVALVLLASERGRVTVYPPEFEFEP